MERLHYRLGEESAGDPGRGLKAIRTMLMIQILEQQMA